MLAIAARALIPMPAILYPFAAYAQDTAPPAGTPVAPDPPTIANALLPQDLSPWGMFLNADIVVKAVIVGLALASLVTWTVWLAKTYELSSYKRRARLDLRVLRDARALAEAHQRDVRGPVAKLVAAAGDEVLMSINMPREGVKERVALQLARIEAGVGRKIARGTGVLATIGATAPFIGLFGTVWGIMNSFIGISKAHTTNLAVVAPGIAEALLATAFGLAAAIPAVVIYNLFARSIGGYRAMLADASAEVMRLASRDLDRRNFPLAPAAE